MKEDHTPTICVLLEGTGQAVDLAGSQIKSRGSDAVSLSGGGLA